MSSHSGERPITVYGAFVGNVVIVDASHRHEIDAPRELETLFDILSFGRHPPAPTPDISS